MIIDVSRQAEHRRQLYSNMMTARTSFPMTSEVVSSMAPLVRIQRFLGLFPVVLHVDRISFSKGSLLTLMSFFLPYSMMFYRIFMVGWNQRTLSSKISVSVYILELTIKGSPMVFLFSPIVELVNDLTISDTLLPSKPKTKNRYLWPVLSCAVFANFYLSSFYFSGVWTITSFLMRLPVALMYHRDYQQLIIFAFFVDQICARFAIVRTMKTRSDNARLAHATLCRCVRKLSDGFGLRYFFIVVTVGYDLLCNVFRNTYFKNENSDVSATVFYALTDLSLLSIFAVLSQTVMNQGRVVGDDLLALSTTNMDMRNVRQVELFLEEVQTTELNITAWGVFSIDIGIFTSFVNTLLTFFIVMAGFSNEIIGITERYHLNN